ncbi:MAG: hypothetical protein LBS24_01705 [Clostridiales Family XIII bacterium]|jgi:hypothetical protein|nr:hypothetical protein [Clostridiales Family XIII bacterium]
MSEGVSYQNKDILRLIVAPLAKSALPKQAVLKLVLSRCFVQYGQKKAAAQNGPGLLD